MELTTEQNNICSVIDRIFHNFKNIYHHKPNSKNNITNILNKQFSQIKFTKLADYNYHNFVIINEQLQGNGLIYSLNGYIYDGYMKNSKPDGYGKLDFQDSSYYLGEWKCGLPHGNGILETPKYKYNGSWENGIA